MLKNLLRAPRNAMIIFVVLVNVLSGVITTLVWIPFSAVVPVAPLRSINALIPMVIAIVLAIVISSFFSKRTAKPLLDMIDATKAISKGDYSVRVEEVYEGEISELLHSFNQMTAELGSTELMRNDFINTFSHEFKTPIVSIRGFAKRLRQEDLTEEKKNEYLNYIVSESERLAELSANILLLSKYENQQFISGQTDYELGEQIRRCVILLEKQWEVKNITFDLDIAEDIPYRNNEEMMDHVWLNIIGNAIKFSHSGGVISISAYGQRGTIDVTVNDEGIGINENAIEHIFDKFYQCDPAHACAGNGLGLPLVHQIIDLCGGEITVKSQVGTGTIFRVSLPMGVHIKDPDLARKNKESSFI